MTATSTLHAEKITRGPAKTPRFFYPAVGVLFLILTLWGFQDFYFHGMSYPNRVTPWQIRPLVIVHGTAMGLWILLFALQPMLVAGRKLKAHMTVGKIGMVLALAVVLTGFVIAVGSAKGAMHVPGWKLWTMNARQFFIVPSLSMLTFSVFIGIAIWKRKRPEIHRPMMMVGTLVALGAAVSRITPLNNLYIGTPLESLFGPYLFTTIIGFILLAVKSILSGKLDKYMAIGLSVLLVEAFTVTPFGRTSLWESIAGLII